MYRSGVTYCAFYDYVADNYDSHQFLVGPNTSDGSPIEFLGFELSLSWVGVSTTARETFRWVVRLDAGGSGLTGSAAPDSRLNAICSTDDGRASRPAVARYIEGAGMSGMSGSWTGYNTVGKYAFEGREANLFSVWFEPGNRLVVGRGGAIHIFLESTAATGQWLTSSTGSNVSVNMYVRTLC